MSEHTTTILLTQLDVVIDYRQCVSIIYDIVN